MHWMRANGKHTKKCPAYRTRPTPHPLKSQHIDLR